ncbi:MAG: SDR family oxidoreductase [Caldilineaceae bacterium]|nr:SDR family oxidoreductase [Caldilineaceae bacterium]
MRLNAKVAIVTGGAQGIGAGISSRLAAEGAAVVVADLNAEKAEAQVATITANGGTALAVRCDVSEQAQVAALFDQTLAHFGRVDILVNNAALVHHPASNVNFLELTAETWHRSLAVNLTGMFYCSQRAARIMVKQVVEKRGNGGAIISLSSGGATRAHRQLMAYDTTKGGIEAATRAMAVDLAPWNIRVNAIAPGNITVSNSLGGAVGPEAARGTIPLGHPGLPADIGATAAFLAADDGAYITGQCIWVDGGMAAQLRSPAVDRQVDPGLLARLETI